MKTFDPLHHTAYPIGGQTKLAVSGYARYGKRAFDLALALALLPVLLPLIAVLWGLASLDGSNGLFGHTRIGRNGAPFRCWKIRTMVNDAERRLALYLATDANAAAEWARDHKLTHDPRITRFGAFLRRTSLDELPQILNVLRGDMSFVGPRPVVEDELKRYGGNLWAYLSQRPGITGIWQVSGRNDVSYAARVAMDVDYLKRESFIFDCSVILRTAGAVIGATGR